MDPELRALLEQLVAANERNEQLVGELAGALDTLMTILVKRGELNDGHLRVIAKLRKHVKLATAPQIALDETSDKYTAEAAPPIDCDKRMHLCHGRCCSFEVRLSRQDLEEGKLEWKIDQPYYLARDQTGFCVYQSKDTGYCDNYEHRPAACRKYDCREDKRVWIDFENMIPAPMPAHLVVLRRRPT